MTPPTEVPDSSVGGFHGESRSGFGPNAVVHGDTANSLINPMQIPVREGDAGPQSRNQARKSRRVACRECRQAKIRCEGLGAGGIGPCNRCRRFSLDCHFDASYKRVNKKAKLSELAEQVQHLRSVVSQGRVGSRFGTGETEDQGNVESRPSPQSNPRRQESTSHVSPSRIGTTHSVLPQPDRSLQNPIQRAPSLSSGRHSFKEVLSEAGLNTIISRTLEDVTLTGYQITNLFIGYFHHYHDFFSILDPQLSPDQYYSRSPLLFWSIISISARRYDEDATLLSSLSQCVTKLMWNTIPKLPHSRFSIQAILLLSMWPFPTSSMSTDTTFLLVSISKSAAMQLGLHRPEVVQDFLRVKVKFGSEQFQEAVKVWAGCYIAANSVSAAIGQPSPFPSDWTIECATQLGTQYTLPTNLRYDLIIQKFTARINMIMGENDRSSNGYPAENESCVLIAMLERDYIDLYRQISGDLNEIQQISMLVACLQLRMYYFFMTSHPDNRKQGLLKAYTTSVDLIHKVQDADQKWNYILYAPNGCCQMITMAGVMLMEVDFLCNPLLRSDFCAHFFIFKGYLLILRLARKIINSSYASYVDSDSGKRAFNSVLALMRKASVENNDIRGRGSKIMAQLWTVHRSIAQRREQEPAISIKTRWGASLLHDSLWMWREEFGGQRTPPPDMQTSSAPAGREYPQKYPSEEHLELIKSTVPSVISSQNTVRHEAWGSESVDPQNQTGGVNMTEQDMIQTQFDTDNFGNIISGLPVPDWNWEQGFSSFLPMDTDVYSSSVPNT